MNILWQLIRNLPPHGRRQRSGGINPLIKKKKGLIPEIQDKLQVVNNSRLIAFAFCPPQQQDRQAMRLFHRIYVQDHRAIGYTLSMFTWIRLIKEVILGGAENFFKPISNICTTTSSLVIPLIFCQFSIINLIENNEFTGFQEFSAPLREVIYHPIQLESISWSLTSFFNQFSIALWISPILSLPVRVCAECIALENHTTSNSRYVRGEGV